MGSDRKVGTRLIARCCYGASLGFGFIVTVLTLSAMFWIAWCYFGLSFVHISDTQRRALVNYSFTTTKTTTTTATPFLNRTAPSAVDETSINSISKSSTATSALRGSSRGELEVKFDKRKESTVPPKSLAKGDFASRERGPHNSSATSLHSQDTATLAVSSPRGPPTIIEVGDDSREKADILSSSVERSDEDHIYARRVSPPDPENRPEEKNGEKSHHKPSDSVADSRPNITPTKVYDVEPKYSSSRLSEESDRNPRDDARTQARDYEERSEPLPPRRDDIQSSRRPDPEPVYREPEFDREYSRRHPLNTERETSRSDDNDDDKRSRSRYDRRDRGRDTEDRYSKGDTRVYPDDAERTPVRPIKEDRYNENTKDRYPEARRGDDDRYDDQPRSYDDRRRYRDRDAEDRRYRERDLDERAPVRDEKLRSDDRYRPRDDDRYKNRDDDPHRGRDDDRYKDRDDDRYRGRDDDRHRDRDDKEYSSRDDDRYTSRDDDRYRYEDKDRYRPRSEDRYRPKEDDRYLSRDDDKYRRDPERRTDSGSRYKDEADTHRPKLDDDRYIDATPTRSRDRDYRESSPESRREYVTEDRKSSVRAEYDSKGDAIVSDYDIEKRDNSRSYGRENADSSRMTRPLYNEDRYRDRNHDDDGYRRSSRPEDNDRKISPTRAKDEPHFSRSALAESRPKDLRDDSRYIDTEKDTRVKNVKYDERDRIFSSRNQGSRSSSSASESSKRVNDDKEYRTRLPDDRSGGAKFIDRREEVVLDHRSYTSEEDDEYRNRNTRRDYVFDDRSRRPSEGSRRYADDERYSRRDSVDDDEYKRSRTRDPSDEDRASRRDRYDDDHRRYDIYSSRDQDRYITRGSQSSSRKYDASSYDDDDDERNRRRNPEPSDIRKDYDDRDERRRPTLPPRPNDDRLYARDEYPASRPSSRRRDSADLSLSDSHDSRDSYAADRRRTETSRQDTRNREPTIGPSMSTINSREPSDVVVREKRYQSSDDRRQSSRASATDYIYNHKNLESIPRPRESPVRPLTAKDVIEAAIRQSDASDQNPRQVYYPVFDPRVSNLTSPEIIRPSERRGTTITAKKKRSTT